MHNSMLIMIHVCIKTQILVFNLGAESICSSHWLLRWNKRQNHHQRSRQCPRFISLTIFLWHKLRLFVNIASY